MSCKATKSYPNNLKSYPKSAHSNSSFSDIQASVKSSKKHPQKKTLKKGNSSFDRSSQIDCKSQTQVFLRGEGEKKVGQEQQQRKNMQIEEQLQREELVRDGLKSTEMEHSKADKIKIGSRFRKLVDTNHLHIQLNGVQTAVEKQDQKQYAQIAKDIKINTLQSKVCVQTEAGKQQNMFQNIQSQQSLVVASPVNLNKQSMVSINIVGHSPAKDDCKKSSNLLQINEQEEKDDKSSLLKLNSDQESAINKSVQRQCLNRNPTKQITSPHSQHQPHTQTKIYQNDNLKHTNLILPQPKKTKKQKLQLLSHTLYWQLDAVNCPQDNTQNKQLELEIKSLKQKVKELRMEKVKERAQMIMLGQSKEAQSQFKAPKTKAENTLISQLNVETQQKQSNSGKGQTIHFGRIRKNRSPNRSGNTSYHTISELKSHRKKSSFSRYRNSKTHHQNNTTHHRNSTIHHQNNTTHHQNSTIHHQNSTIHHQNSTPRHQLNPTQRISSQFSRYKEQKSVQIQNHVNFYQSMQKKADSKAQRNSNQIRQHLMHKLESDDKKFHKFLIRESRLRTKRFQQNKSQQKVNPELQRYRQKTEEVQFQGTIVKNYHTRQFNQSASREEERLSFINAQTLKMIRLSENKKLCKRKIQFTKVVIPQIPDSLSSKTQTEELMTLIFQILPYSDETYTEEDLKHCLIKKFKNCIMFELPKNQNFRIIWYFSGKLYMGDWNPSSNQKQGEGLQFYRNKYFYKGQFSKGKKNGRGIFIHINGSIYEGQFCQGQRSGTGKYFDAVNKSLYQGQWNKGKMEGWGYYEYQNTVYQGQFFQDFKHGFGIQYFNQGDKYFGQYAANQFHGQGKYVWADGASYIGHFRNSQRHDFGIWVSPEPNLEIYQGFYTKDKKQGSGKYVWANGCVYQGNFDNDLKHGIGTMQYPDGQWMEGIWVQGILSDVISKLSEAQRQNPLRQADSKVVQTSIRAKVRDIGEVDDL